MRCAGYEWAEVPIQFGNVLDGWGSVGRRTVPPVGMIMSRSGVGAGPFRFALRTLKSPAPRQSFPNEIRPSRELSSTGKARLRLVCQGLVCRLRFSLLDNLPVRRHLPIGSAVAVQGSTARQGGAGVCAAEGDVRSLLNSVRSSAYVADSAPRRCNGRLMFAFSLALREQFLKCFCRIAENQVDDASQNNRQ